jgi:PAS domain S-box-containing protein
MLALAPGLLITAVLAVLDLSIQPSTAVVGLVVLAPLVTAVLGRPRDVAVVGGFAVAFVVVSAAWRDNLAEAINVYRVLVVALVSLLAVVGTRVRFQVSRDRERFAMLAAVGEIADGTRTLTDTVAGLNDIVVPALADACIVDAMSQGELQRLAVRAAGESGERVLAARPPSTGDGIGDPEQPRLLAAVDDATLRRIATGPEDLERLRGLRVTSAMLVPLRSRGRRLGTLTLLVTEDSGRRYDEGDLEFARVLAGRAALALDNAGLFAELETIEGQLTAALATLAEAVTVQHAEGALIYANEAAARMLGLESAQQVLATPVEQMIDAFEARKEDGSPMTLDDLPGRRVLAGEEPRPLVVQTIDRATGEVAWRLLKASGVFDRDGGVRLVVNVIEDISEVKRAEMTQRLLARAGELLASSLDYERTLQQVAELAVPQLADWCAVSLPDAHGAIRVVAVAHVDPDKVAFARRLTARYPSRADAASGVGKVLRDGIPQVMDEITDELLATVAQDEEHLALLREVGMRSAVVVPMRAGRKVIGAISLVAAESPRRFSTGDVELAEELGRRAGWAVAHTRLYTERSRIAHTLQEGLLPGNLPQMPGWSLAKLYRPAGEENWVGGDFYDALEVHGGWLALVGDVAGRGAEAAALTGLARHTLRTAARLLDDPLEAVGTLNAELRTREQMALCSVAAVVLREDGGRATAEVICAGHPLPLLVRDRAVRPVGRFSPMLGAYPVRDWSRTTVEIEPGDVLVLYTDGVFDAVGADGRFGEERLQRTVEGAVDARDAVTRIDAALTAFEVGEQADDTAVLAVERVAVEVPTLAVRGGGARGDRR